MYIYKNMNPFHNFVRSVLVSGISYIMQAIFSGKKGCQTDVLLSYLVQSITTTCQAFQFSAGYNYNFVYTVEFV